MSVLIKGMEMPSRCEECPCFRHDSLDGVHHYQCNINLTAVLGDGNARLNNCPLVEIPTPHGRLIDFDSMIDEYWDGYCMEIAKWNLKDIPTVIEAEECAWMN